MSGLTRFILSAAFALCLFPLHAADQTPGTNQIIGADRTVRIVGGSEVTDQRYPWMASIYFRVQNDLFSPGCGGSLIADRWILTAAHCVIEDGEVLNPEDLAFLLGELDLTSDDGLFNTVSRIIVHPDYNDSLTSNDLALLELPDAVDFITPITLPSLTNPVPENGELATVTGWGLTAEEGAPSSTLLEVDLPIVSHNDCFSFYLYGAPVDIDSQNTVCAGATRVGGVDSCQGDSGGPLFVRRGNEFVQAGIVSSGLGCALPGVPGIYTRVAPYFNWINSFVDSPTVYNGGNDSEVEAVDEIVQSLAANSRITAFASIAETNVYRVSSSNRITLQTLQGDADLFVYNSPVFSLDSQVCSSFEENFVIDECELSNVGSYYVGVYGYVSSDYNLTVSNGQGQAVDLQPVTLQLEIPQGGALQTGTSAVFRATTGSNAILTSTSGDANLMVFSDDEFIADNLICFSRESGSALDSCTYGGSGAEVFVTVTGSTNANYQLTVSDSATQPSVVTPQAQTANNNLSAINSSNSPSDDSGGGGISHRFILLLALLAQLKYRRRTVTN